jgi:formylglycine-generating enzyme required for sulfatase activity
MYFHRNFSQLERLLFLLYTIVSTSLLGGLVYSAEPVSSIGIVEKAPEGVRSVKTERGFMVPYTVKLTDKVSFEMIPIPGGKFKLGSPNSEKGRAADEGPQVEVTIKPFWMAKYETSWEVYKVYMADIELFMKPDNIRAVPLAADNAADAVTAPSRLYEPTYTFEYGEDPKLPAVTMSQFAARQYTKWLSNRTTENAIYRLPNEAEWEYACRAGTTTAYSTGDDSEQLADYAWTSENAEEKPHHIGTKKPNPWGLHDMHGNVMEWTLDGYTVDAYKKIGVVKELPLKSLELTQWPTSMFPRIVRGGSFEFSADKARSAAKLASHKDWYDTDPNRPKSPWWLTDDPARGVGMRVIRPLNPPTKEGLEKCWEPDDELTKNAIEVRLRQGKGSRAVLKAVPPVK